jgi:hypothetical protein
MARTRGYFGAVGQSCSGANKSVQSLAKGRHLGSVDGRGDKGAHDGQVQMIDSSIVLVSPARFWSQKRVEIVAWDAVAVGLTTKIQARVDGQGRPIQILITPGQAHDLTDAVVLLANLRRGTVVTAQAAVPLDKGDLPTAQPYRALLQSSSNSDASPPATTSLAPTSQLSSRSP